MVLPYSLVIGNTELVLKCLRRWPEQCADIAKESSAGVWPVSKPGCLYQRIQEVTVQGLSFSNLHAIHAAMAVAAAVQGRGDMTVANVHICGEGYAGKTMTRKALQKSLNTPSRLLLGYALKDLGLEEGRTLGMVSEAMELRSDAVRVLLHDYGGQQEFRANHAAHLASPNSVYLLVVPLWDKRLGPNHDKPMELDIIVETYASWLKFINTIVPASEHKAQCITVLNFIRKFQGQTRMHSIETVVERLSDVQQSYKDSSESKIAFVDPIILVNSNIPASVHKRIVPVLKQTIQALSVSPVPVARAVQAVLQDQHEWPLFCYEKHLIELLMASIFKNIAPLLDAVGCQAAVDYVVHTIAVITLKLLEARRDIVVFPVATGERVSINRPNWLTEKLLGSLFDPKKRRLEGSVGDHLLTFDQIITAATSLTQGKTASVDNDIFPKLLHPSGVEGRGTRHRGVRQIPQ